MRGSRPMRLIQGYLFRQLLLPTLLAIAALGGVALLSQTLSTLDLVVSQRQGLFVFAKIILLNMPQLLATVAPIAIFVAALMVMNRLQVEQELVICFAGGMGRWSVISPAMRLTAAAALLILAANLWVQPLAARAMREELFKVRTDLMASLIREGEFAQPASGLTVYAQATDQSGMLRNIFIHQENPGGRSSSYAARRGFLAKPNGRPALIMREGSSQEFDTKGVLNYLGFDEYVFDLQPFIENDDSLHLKASDRFLHELAFPDLTQDWERQNRVKMLAEAHYRLSSPLYAFTFMALALWAVIGGAFSRRGYASRIGLAAFYAALARIIGFAVQAASDGAAAVNILQYVVPLVPVALAIGALLRRAPPGASRIARFLPFAAPVVARP